MIKIQKLIISMVLIFCAPLALACNYPTPPKDLPDGTTSTKDEMLAGVKLIAAYQEDMTAYLSCIETNEIEANKALAGDGDEKKQRKELFEKKYNAAISTQIRTVELFNVEIRVFKEKLK